MLKHPELNRFHIGGLVVIVAAAIAVVAVWRAQVVDLAEARSDRAAEIALGPHVQAAEAVRGPTDRTIRLLADVRPYQNAILYAKVSGYLKSMKVDRGDKVEAGQILAEIESVETDNQYAAAVADLENKRKLTTRARELAARGTTSTQAREQAETNERMARAVVSQLEALRSYEVIRAPFAGTVTARFADPGALIQNAGTNQTSSLPVATIADSSKLRVAVYVSQPDVPFIHVGDPAEISDAANPDREVRAVISRTAEMLDPATRTLLVEIDVDNKDQFLFPGSFAYATLHAPVKSYVRIPATALIVRNNDQIVAVVRDNGTVQFRRVKIASVDGATIDVADGIEPGEKIALSVPDEVVDGSRVQPVMVAARTR
jgi:RND family efflux transporter MFP subunit